MCPYNNGGKYVYVLTTMCGSETWSITILRTQTTLIRSKSNVTANVKHLTARQSKVHTHNTVDRNCEHFEKKSNNQNRDELDMLPEEIITGGQRDC